ncbi:SusC/RagA family TonB-linked outer membrane protein, partial [Arenibacter sp. M-2]|uniref:SusC/RagA family TonB-linked outer membrane protein n=1 Tax=Arenibacter sp. M-2 TaxID=3053612 RepID=UPI0025703C09
FQHAFVQSHNLNLNGGTEKIKFNLGINYWNQPGVVKLYRYDRINLLMNLDAKINDWISAGGQVNITRGVSKEPSLGDEEIFLGYFNQKPTTPPQFPDGRWVSTQFPDEYFTWGAAEKLARGQSVKQQYFGDVQAYLKIIPVDGLIWETKVATSYKHSFGKNFNKGNHAVYVYTTEELTEPQNPNSRRVDVDSPTSLYNTLYSTVNYEKITHKHHVEALAGYSVESYNIDNLRAGRSNYPTDNLGEINAGDSSTRSNSGSSEAYSLQSVFGRFDYNYDDKYLFQANLRSDWSSRFPKGNRLGVFPSFSAGWRISNENFFKNSTWLSGLKLRASWGQLGNQNIGVYPYQETYSLGKNYPFDGLEVGALQDGLKDQNITWETTTITDAGFDMNIKNGLFTMSFDYYYKLTDDILRSQQVTALVGMNGPTINNGSVSNKGFEILAGHSKQLNKLKYWLNANFSYNKNTLEKFGSTEIGSTTIKEEGREWNTWYLYKFDGVYQNDADAQALPINGNIMKPGTAKFKDLNGDGQITNIDRTYVGNRIPKFNYGFNFGIQSGFFDFSAFIQGVQGVKTYQNLFGIAPFVQMSRPSTFWRDAWTTENQSNTIPALYVGRTGNVLDNYPNTFYLFNASYVRLKNIQLGYNIPSHILEPFKMSSARIALSGENLITVTKYPGQDPERNLGDALYSTYPQNKSYSIEITVKF